MDAPRELREKGFRGLLVRTLDSVTFERLLIGVIGLGIAYRLITIWTGVVYADGAFYSALAEGILRNGDYVVPWLDIRTYTYSLTYPLYLSGFYSIFGFDIHVTKTASVIVSLLVLAVVYFTTKDLFDRRRGLIAAAYISINITLITLVSRNHIENIVLLFSVPAFWALLKAGQDSRYYLLFGVFAGLTYYSKTDLGLSAVIAVAVLIPAWAFWQERWDAAKDPYLYLGIAILVLFGVVRWYLVTNLSDISATNVSVYAGSLMSVKGGASFASQIPIHLVLLGSFVAFWVRELYSSLKKIREREIGILWLASLGFLLVIIAHAAVYPAFSLVPVKGVSAKYITILFVPILWLVFYETSFDRPIGRLSFSAFWKAFLASLKRWRRVIFILIGMVATLASLIFLDEWIAVLVFLGSLSVIFTNSTVRLGILLVAFLLLSTNAMTAVTEPPFLATSAMINEDLRSGDTIAVHRIEAGEGSVPGLSTLYLYPYLDRRDLTVKLYEDGDNVTYILSHFQQNYSGYTLIGTFHDKSESTILKRGFSGIVSIILGREAKSGREPTIYLWKNDYR